MDIVALARYLNQISETEDHYDNLPVKVQKIYQKRASWIITYFIDNGWTCVEGAKNTEQANQPDSASPRRLSAR